MLGSAWLLGCLSEGPCSASSPGDAVSPCCFSSVQSLSRVRLFATPWTAARQASLSITSSRGSPRLVLAASWPRPPCPSPAPGVHPHSSLLLHGPGLPVHHQLPGSTQTRPCCFVAQNPIVFLLSGSRPWGEVRGKQDAPRKPRPQSVCPHLLGTPGGPAFSARSQWPWPAPQV